MADKKQYNYDKRSDGKNDTGRPTDYKEEYCEKILYYFDKIPYNDRVSGTSSNEKTGVYKEFVKTRPVDFPTFEGFAASIDVCIDTMIEWAKKYPDFSESYRKAKHIQKDLLIINGLNGLYKEGFSKFVAINCFPEMKDKSEQEVTINETELTEEQVAKIVAKYKIGK